MQEIKLSDESVQAIAAEVSNQVCDRIGDALVTTGRHVGTLAIVFGIAGILLNCIHIKRERYAITLAQPKTSLFS
jgi:hypothetical protein